MKTLPVLQRFLLLLALAGAADAGPAFLPWPKTVDLDGRQQTLGGRIVATDPRLAPLAEVLSGAISRMTGVTLAPADGGGTAGDIILKLDPGLAGESHRLDLRDSAVITGGNYQAAAWGCSTLLQALAVVDGELRVPTGRIADEPDYRLRSAECDIARKWHPIANLRELIDLFSFYKLNHIQLHLNDHGMHTFGTELHPELPTRKDGRVRHYTKAELRDLVAYARDRGVAIIPELEMPGHTDAPGLLPEIFGTKDPATGQWKSSGYVNVCRDDTVEACKRMLNEVMDVFTSSAYVSIGADEVADARFATLPEHAEFQRKYPGEKPYQRFIAQMNECAKARGKQLLVYGRGGPPDVLQMPWSGNDNALARQGYQIMPHNSGSVTHHLPTLMDPPYNTILLYSGFKAAYEFDLTRDKKIAPGNIKQVVGIHTLTWQHWHYMHLFDLRRTVASLSENAWNHHRRDQFLPFEEWREQRWAPNNAKLDDLLFPVKATEEGLLSPGKDLVFAGQMKVSLGSARKGTIRYHREKLDYWNPPPLPTAASPAYEGPITLTEPTVIYAALFDEAGQRIGHGTERRYWPITPKITCHAFDGAEIRRKLDATGPNPAQPHPPANQQTALPVTLEALELLGLKPAHSFPLARLTFHPSFEGIYQWDWLLVMEGKFLIAKPGGHEFRTFPNQSALSIDGKPVASTLAKSPRETTTVTGKVDLAAGEHAFKVLVHTGSKARRVVEFRRAGEADGAWKSFDDLIMPLGDSPPMK